MYIPKRFLQDDINNLKGMMTNHAFATFISKNESGIEANHMPLILNESGQRDVLQGHIAKANPLLEGREKEVYEIYTRLNNANRHKMDPIPVCTIPRD